MMAESKRAVDEASRPASRGPLVFGILLVWTSSLHGLLFLLWPERTQYGLTTLSTRTALAPNHPVIFLFLTVILLGVLLKLRRLRPGVPTSLLMTAPGSPKRIARVFGFYALLAVGGALLGASMTLHFAATIGIYCLLMTLAAGVLFGGERRPFLGLTLEPTAEDVATRRRLRIIDALCLFLLALLYASFVFYYEIRDWEYNLTIPRWALFQLVLTIGCIGLGWCLLHGSLRNAVGTYLRRLDHEASLHSGSSAEAFREVSAHGAVVAGIFVTMRLLNEGIDWLRAHDAWFVSERSDVFLGVDWYFVSVRESTEMGELFVFLGFVVLHLGSAWGRGGPRTEGEAGVATDLATDLAKEPP